jgi:hypothetical protein
LGTYVNKTGKPGNRISYGLDETLGGIGIYGKETIAVAGRRETGGMKYDISVLTCGSQGPPVVEVASHKLEGCFAQTPPRSLHVPHQTDNLVTALDQAFG